MILICVSWYGPLITYDKDMYKDVSGGFIFLFAGGDFLDKHIWALFQTLDEKTGTLHSENPHSSLQVSFYQKFLYHKAQLFIN